jgi:hydrogenase maturation protease
LKEPDGPIILERIRSLALSRTTVVIGLGNPDRADDGAGIEIVSHWKARLKERAFFDTETSAETAVFDGLEDPEAEVFLFVDAADFGGEPGEIRLFGREETDRFQPAISTHKVPIGLLTQMIRSRGRQAYLLGIQPGSVELFGGMTGGVREAVKTLQLLMNQENSGRPSNTD